jgi:hypothetical protein
LVGESRVQDGNRHGVPHDQADVLLINVVNQLEALGYQLRSVETRADAQQVVKEMWLQAPLQPPRAHVQRREPLGWSMHAPLQWPPEMHDPRPHDLPAHDHIVRTPPSRRAANLSETFEP